MTTTTKPATKPSPSSAKKPAAKRTTTKTAAAKAAAAPAGAEAQPTFDPAYPIKDLKPHPKNPRRSAVADPEMVASIREHGILEPIVIGPDGTIIMGHCRTDGAKKAKRPTVPVLIRPDLDTPAKQLEVMLVENLHRTNLTELEEAESFGLLKELGYTQKDIAAKVGRSQKLVGDRLKLLRLSKKSQDALHKGQMTFADAVALAEFDDDPKLQDRLAKKTGYQLSQAIDRERRDRRAMVDINRRVAEYDAAGVPEVKVKAGTQSWDLRTSGTPLLEDTHPGKRPQSHKKCMAYVILPSTEYNAPRLLLVCTNPKGHKKPGPSKAELAEKARREKQEAEARAAEQDRADARAGRFTALTTLIGPAEAAGLDDRVSDVLRVLVPTLAWDLTSRQTEWFFAAADIAVNARWRAVETYSRNLEDVAAYGQFVKLLGSYSNATVLRILVALLAVHTEYALDPDLRHEHLYARSDERGTRTRLTGRVYLGLLQGIGHDFTDIDAELHTNAMWAPEKPAAEPADAPEASTDAGDEEEPVDLYDLVHLYDDAGLAACRLPGTAGKTLTTTRELDNVTCPNCVDEADLAEAGEDE